MCCFSSRYCPCPYKHTYMHTHIALTIHTWLHAAPAHVLPQVLHTVGSFSDVGLAVLAGSMPCLERVTLDKASARRAVQSNTCSRRQCALCGMRLACANPTSTTVTHTHVCTLWEITMHASKAALQTEAWCKVHGPRPEPRVLSLTLQYHTVKVMSGICGYC